MLSFGCLLLMALSFSFLERHTQKKTMSLISCHQLSSLAWTNVSAFLQSTLFVCYPRLVLCQLLNRSRGVVIVFNILFQSTKPSVWHNPKSLCTIYCAILHIKKKILKREQELSGIRNNKLKFIAPRNTAVQKEFLLMTNTVKHWCKLPRESETPLA